MSQLQTAIPEKPHLALLYLRFLFFIGGVFMQTPQCQMSTIEFHSQFWFPPVRGVDDNEAGANAFAFRLRSKLLCNKPKVFVSFSLLKLKYFVEFWFKSIDYGKKYISNWHLSVPFGYIVNCYKPTTYHALTSVKCQTNIMHCFRTAFVLH